MVDGGAGAPGHVGAALGSRRPDRRSTDAEWRQAEDSVPESRAYFSYPHPHDEGTYSNSAPSHQQILDKTTADQAYDIFVGNAARIYGFDVEALAEAA